MTNILAKSILSSKNTDVMHTEALRNRILSNYIKKPNEQLAEELIRVT